MLALLIPWCQQMTPPMTNKVTVAIEYMSLDEDDIAPSYEDEGFHEQGEPHWVDDGADHRPDGGWEEDGRCDVVV